MKKVGKLVALFLTLTMLVGSFAGTTVFAAGTNSDFTIANGVLVKYTGAGGDVSIPSSVTSIGYTAFQYCTDLSSIVIPSNVTNIGIMAFHGCTGLSSISIPSSVTSIGRDAFAECTGLATISVDAANTNYRSDNGILFNKDETTLVQYPIASTQTSYAIPSSVTEVGGFAFAGCKSLANITVPSTVTRIGEGAFEETPWIKSQTAEFVILGKNILYKYNGTGGAVTVPSTVTSISSAFAGCDALTSITIPSCVTDIDDCAFMGCTGLTSIVIPSKVTNIGFMAFMGCTGLTNIPIPSGVTSIGDAAFSLCAKLTSISIPNSVTSIGDAAFSLCSKLTDVTVPKSVTKIGDMAFVMDTKVTIYGDASSAAQTYATKNSIAFKPLIVRNGVGYRGTVMFDTQSYNMSPRNIYDIGVKLAGNGSTKTVKVTSSRDGIATVRKLPNGNYRVTGVNPGTTYILCTIYDGTKEITHVSIKVTVAKGVKQGGVATRNTSYFN